MGFFGKLFDKKECSICGGEIGLLGNRKLEDGNMCKSCAAKLSPWFSDRRQSTVAEINDQLAYRENNQGKVAAFRITRTLGENMKVLLDEDAGLFMVTAARNLADANPDVLAFSDVTGCKLDIDEHNCLPTTDGRLIRRIVRDARTRATSARETIAMWDSVRRGEEKNIFPFQEGADVMFNSALIYELAVLKQYAEPLLFAIERDCPEYLEAKRLLKFLDYFVGIGSENVPANSLLREFIGGGCFRV